MNIECRLDDLLALIGRQLSIDELEETLFLLKVEVESVDGNIIELEINPDRPDMLSTEGVARAVRSFLGIETGLKKYRTRKSGKSVIVSRGMKKIREFIACGIVKGVETSDELIKEYMRLQEALTTTHGRNRKKASIGLYVYDDIHFPVHYTLRNPTKIKFAPLGYDEVMDGPTILERHDKGQIYGPIIAEYKKWPLLVDDTGNILSLPPVINSNTLGQVDITTRNIFVEVTGTHLQTVEQALTIMVTSLAERGGSVETATMEYPDGTLLETPDLTPTNMDLDIDMTARYLGLDLTATQITGCLRKMGYSAKRAKKGVLDVKIPAYRTDILHPVDLIEDVAIGYGYNNLEPSLPATMTAGKLRPMTRIKNKVRDLIIGMGYQEVLTYVMSSPELLNDKMLRDQPVITTGNPKSRDFSVLRNAILPVLLDFLTRNQHADLPIKIFEVGDIAFPDETMETKVRQESAVCGLVCDSRVNLTDLMTNLGFLLRNLGFDGRFKFNTASLPWYIDGRCGEVTIDERVVGQFGELSPEVLTKFDIGFPVVAFELNLSKQFS